MVKLRIDPGDGTDDEIGFDVPDADTYECTVESIKYLEAKKGGKPGLLVEYRIHRGEKTGETFADWRFREVLSLSDEDFPVRKRRSFFKKLGWRGDTDEIDTDQFVGKPIIVQTKQEEYNGYTNLRGRRYIMHPNVKAELGIEDASGQAGGQKPEESDEESQVEFVTPPPAKKTPPEAKPSAEASEPGAKPAPAKTPPKRNFV